MTAIRRGVGIIEHLIPVLKHIWASFLIRAVGVDEANGRKAYLED